MWKQLLPFLLQGVGDGQKVFIECTTPFNQRWIVKARVRITYKHYMKLIICCVLHLNLKERFWMVGANISYFNSFG